MTREQLIQALGERAAESLTLARSGHQDAYRFADEVLFDAANDDVLDCGQCLAAINHINGVSPE